jgi:branched-chain amino acid transport system substrate-binding protein
MHAEKINFRGNLLTLVLLFFVLSSCMPPGDPIRVGFLANLTGANSALGVDGRDGVQVAIEKLNAEGGVNGRRIELIVRDNLGTEEGSIAAAHELINDEGVFVIIGHMTSSMMVATWEKTRDSGVIYLSPTASASQLTGLDDNFLRLTPATSTFAQKLAEYATNDLGLKRFAVFYDMDNGAFTDAYLKGFTEEIISGKGEIIWEYGFSSSSTPDFKSVLEGLKGLHPEGILIIASASDTALIAQQIRLCGCDAQLLTSNWALTKDLLENGGTAVDGIVAVATYNENNHSQEYLEFSSRFQERFGRAPSFSAGYGYEAMLVLADALKKTNGFRKELKQALLKTDGFRGVFGDISLDQYGDARRSLYLVAIRNGQFVTEKSFPVQ